MVNKSLERFMKHKYEKKIKQIFGNEQVIKKKNCVLNRMIIPLLTG